MLLKKYRLPIQEFSNKAYVRKVSAQYVLVKTQNNAKGYNRIGVIISKKVFSKATLRNLWKRRLMEDAGRWPNIGQDFLVIALPLLARATRTSLAKEMNSAFQSLNK